MNFVDTAISLIIARVDSYLRDNGTSESLARYPVLERAVLNLNDDALKSWAMISGRKGGDIEEGDGAGYMYALKLLEEDTILQTLMELCMAEFRYPEFTVYLEEHFGYASCLKLAALIEGREIFGAGETERLARLTRRVLEIDLRSEPLQYVTVKADERFMGFIEGSDGISLKLSDFTELYKGEDTHEAFVNSYLIESGIAYFEEGGKALALTGTGGRRFIARHIAKGLSRAFLFLDIADLIRGIDMKDIAPLRDALIRECYYHGAGVCLYGFDERFITGGSPDRKRGRRDMDALYGLLFNPLIMEGIPLIICVDDKEMVPVREGIRSLTLPASYSFDDRKKLWQGLFDLHGLKLDPDSFASRYRMEPKEAFLAVSSYLEASPEGDADEERFARISIESIRNNDPEVGRVIYSDIRLSDVKLKDGVKRVLEDAVNAALLGPVVLDGWGLRKNYPYGRGVSLLMAGPPGTGKTMSANAIAGELSLPLYQVNLSNTVDKYIGETEKNLEKAFLFAEKNNAILFFDEADALFGVRSEVHDSKDRYANTEISYLLQRMEAYDGIVVMATNIKGNIDPAFMRRIRFVAHFENPDEEMRRAIWESCITDAVPHEDIDLDYLAFQFDKFTGSVIKTVFLNACVLAAGDGGMLDMKHLIYAIKQETEKESAIGFAMDTLGKYAYLI